MLVTVKGALFGEFGMLGWLFIGGYALSAMVYTLGQAGAIALLKRGWRWHVKKGSMRMAHINNQQCDDHA